MRSDDVNGHPAGSASAVTALADKPARIASNGNVRATAVAYWQHVVAAGQQPPSGADLARRYGRSASWGRDVARQARHTLPVSGSPGAPGGAVSDGGGAVSSSSAGVARSNEGVAAPGALSAGQPGSGVPGWLGEVRALAVLLVATAAAVASVDHLADVARLAGTTGWKVWLLPAAVDGLATTGALELYRAHRTDQNAGVQVWVTLIGGVVTSVAGNVVAVYPELVDLATLKIAVGATPPLSLALVLHLAFGPVHRECGRPSGPDSSVPQPPPAAAPE